MEDTLSFSSYNCFKLFYGHIKTDSCDNMAPITNAISIKERIQFFKILYENDINNSIFITIDINFIKIVNVTHGFDGYGGFFSIN